MCDFLNMDDYDQYINFAIYNIERRGLYRKDNRDCIILSTYDRKDKPLRMEITIPGSIPVTTKRYYFYEAEDRTLTLKTDDSNKSDKLVRVLELSDADIRYLQDNKSSYERNYKLSELFRNAESFLKHANGIDKHIHTRILPVCSYPDGRLRLMTYNEYMLYSDHVYCDTCPKYLYYENEDLPVCFGDDDTCRRDVDAYDRIVIFDETYFSNNGYGTVLFNRIGNNIFALHKQDITESMNIYSVDVPEEYYESCTLDDVYLISNRKRVFSLHVVLYADHLELRELGHGCLTRWFGENEEVCSTIYY